MDDIKLLKFVDKVEKRQVFLKMLYFIMVLLIQKRNLLDGLINWDLRKKLEFVEINLWDLIFIFFIQYFFVMCILLKLNDEFGE